MKRSTPLRRSGRLQRHRVRRPTRRMAFISCNWSGCRKPLRIAGYCRPHAIAACDRACRRFILARDRHCQRCGTDRALVWAHILSRRSHVIRWDERNAIALCANDEIWFTDNPFAFHAFIEELVPGRIQQLRDIRASGRRPNLADVLARYTKEAA